MTELEIIRKQINDKEEYINKNYNILTDDQLSDIKMDIQGLKLTESNLELAKLLSEFRELNSELQRLANLPTPEDQI